MTFRDRCYELLSQIPKGRVVTYGTIANKLGSRAYRAVGTAMKNNPNPISTPCHRVIRSDGSIGEYVYGAAKKMKLLQAEGIEIDNGKVKNFDTLLYDFND